MQDLKNAVRTGRFVPGQRLIEPDLVHELGYSRGTVREALRVLSGEGLIEIVRWKGARVRRMSPAELVEMARVFSALLSIGIALAIERLGDKRQRRQLEAAYDRLHGRLDAHTLASSFKALDDYLQTIFVIADCGYLSAFLQRPDVQIYQAQVEFELRHERAFDWRAIAAHFETVHRAIMAGDLAIATRAVQSQMRRLAAAAPLAS